MSREFRKPNCKCEVGKSTFKFIQPLQIFKCFRCGTEDKSAATPEQMDFYRSFKQCLEHLINTESDALLQLLNQMMTQIVANDTEKFKTLLGCSDNLLSKMVENKVKAAVNKKKSSRFKKAKKVTEEKKNDAS